MVDFIKVCLKATTPLGTQTEDLEDDKAFLNFMTTNEELIDLGERIQGQKDENGVVSEEEESPPGYTRKLKDLEGRRRGTTPMPMMRLYSKGMSTTSGDSS